MWMLTVGLVFIVQTLSFMNCSCNFICGLSDVIIKTFSQSVSQSVRRQHRRKARGRWRERTADWQWRRRRWWREQSGQWWLDYRWLIDAVARRGFVWHGYRYLFSLRFWTEYTIRETHSLHFAVTWPDTILYTVSNYRLLITHFHTVVVVGPVCKLPEKSKGLEGFWQAKMQEKGTP